MTNTYTALTEHIRHPDGSHTWQVPGLEWGWVEVTPGEWAEWMDVVKAFIGKPTNTRSSIVRRSIPKKRREEKK